MSNIIKIKDASFVQSKLVSVGSQVLTLNNEKKTPYRLGVVEYTTKHGEVKTSTAQVWESVAPQLSVGNSYLSEVRVNDGKVYLTVTPLTQAGYADMDDFDM